MTPVFEKTLVRAGRTRSFHISHGLAGWETATRSDHEVDERQHLHDWHQVERAVARFAREVADLRREGWREADPLSHDSSRTRAER